MRHRSRLLALATALVAVIAAGPVMSDRAAAADRVIVVQPGETLTAIAVREGVSLSSLVTLNGIADPDRIYAGQRLRVRGGRAGGGSPPASARRTHRIAYGETLSGIALRYRTSVDALAAANGIVDPSFVRAGQLLRVPARAATPRAPRHRRGAGSPGAVMPAHMAALVAERQVIGRQIASEARRQGVPRAFALAVAWQESGWQPRVVSSAGAIGVMQLLPATADWVGATMLGRSVDPWNPRANIRAGVRLLRHYLDRYGGNRSTALAAYYQGQSAADTHGIYAVSRPYIASILHLERIFAR